MTLEILIKAAANGSEAAKSQLYDLFWKKMFKVCFNIVEEEEEAIDCMLEGMNEFLTQLHKFHYQSELETWSYVIRIMKRKSYRHLKKIKKKEEIIPKISEEKFESIARTEPNAYSKMDMKVLNGLVDTLSEQRRKVFRLFHNEGLKHKEIAKVLNLDESTTQSHLSRACKQLQKLIIKRFGS